MLRRAQRPCKDTVMSVAWNDEQSIEGAGCLEHMLVDFRWTDAVRLS
jgi:hypothetical protein